MRPLACTTRNRAIASASAPRALPVWITDLGQLMRQFSCRVNQAKQAAALQIAYYHFVMDCASFASPSGTIATDLMFARTDDFDIQYRSKPLMPAPTTTIDHAQIRTP